MCRILREMLALYKYYGIMPLYAPRERLVAQVIAGLFAKIPKHFSKVLLARKEKCFGGETPAFLTCSTRVRLGAAQGRCSISPVIFFAAKLAPLFLTPFLPFHSPSHPHKSPPHCLSQQVRRDHGCREEEREPPAARVNRRGTEHPADPCADVVREVGCIDDRSHDEDDHRPYFDKADVLAEPSENIEARRAHVESVHE